MQNRDAPAALACRALATTSSVAISFCAATPVL